MIASPQLILSGMETPVNLAAFTLALAAAFHLHKSWKSIFVTGVLIGLTCLARVDNLIMTPAFALILLYRNGILQSGDRFSRTLRSMLCLITPILFIFGPYVVSNMLVFGHALPISGEVKSTLQSHHAEAIGGRFSLAYLMETTRATIQQYSTIFNNHLMMLLIAFSPVTLLARAVLAVGLLLLVITIWKRRKLRLSTNEYRALLPLSIAGVVVLNTLFHTWILFFQLGERNASVLNWYYVPEYILLSIMLGFLMQGIARLLRADTGQFYRVTGLALIASLLVSMGVFIWHFEHPAGVQPLLAHYRATQWANEQIPDSDIIGAFNAGVVGYFSDATVINLDGLMNDDEILHLVRSKGSYADYLIRHNIGWVMDYTGIN